MPLKLGKHESIISDLKKIQNFLKENEEIFTNLNISLAFLQDVEYGKTRILVTSPKETMEGGPKQIETPIEIIDTLIEAFKVPENGKGENGDNL